MSNPTNTIQQGPILKQLREERKIPQSQIYKNGAPDSVCSKRQVIRIEQGECNPQPYILYKYLDVLGVTLAEFEHLCYGGDKLLFDNDFAVLWEHGFSNRMDEFTSELAALKQKPYCNMAIPTIEQAILLCESVILSVRDKEHKASLENLYKAIQLTRPDLLTKTNKVKLEKVSDAALVMADYRILRQIAIVLKKMGKKADAYKTEEAVIASLENAKLNHAIPKKILPVAYYNFAHSLVGNKEYNKAISLVGKALEFCTSVREYKMYADLIYVSAKANFLLGNINRAKELFMESCNTHKTLGSNEQALEVIKNAKELYNIKLD